jgi:hypothetical protein
MVDSNLAYKLQVSDEQLSLAPLSEFEAAVTDGVRASIQSASDHEHERTNQRLIAERSRRQGLQMQLDELKKAQKRVTVRYLRPLAAAFAS